MSYVVHFILSIMLYTTCIYNHIYHTVSILHVYIYIDNIIHCILYSTCSCCGVFHGTYQEYQLAQQRLLSRSSSQWAKFFPGPPQCLSLIGPCLQPKFKHGLWVGLSEVCCKFVKKIQSSGFASKQFGKEVWACKRKGSEAAWSLPLIHAMWKKDFQNRLTFPSFATLSFRFHVMEAKQEPQAAQPTKRHRRQMKWFANMTIFRTGLRVPKGNGSRLTTSMYWRPTAESKSQAAWLVSKEISQIWNKWMNKLINKLMSIWKYDSCWQLEILPNLPSELLTATAFPQWGFAPGTTTCLSFKVETTI